MATKKTKAAPERPTVTGVTLNIAYPNGSTKTITVDAWDVEGIFWSDKAVLEMLAPFYDKIGKVITIDELKERFGASRLKPLKQKSGEVLISPDLIQTLWNTPGEQGHLPPVMMKTRNGIPTPGPGLS